MGSHMDADTDKNPDPDFFRKRISVLLYTDADADTDKNSDSDFFKMDIHITLLDY